MDAVRARGGGSRDRGAWGGCGCRAAIEAAILAAQQEGLDDGDPEDVSTYDNGGGSSGGALEEKEEKKKKKKKKKNDDGEVRVYWGTAPPALRELS